MELIPTTATPGVHSLTSRSCAMDVDGNGHDGHTGVYDFTNNNNNNNNNGSGRQELKKESSGVASSVEAVTCNRLSSEKRRESTSPRSELSASPSTPSVTAHDASSPAGIAEHPRNGSLSRQESEDVDSEMADADRDGGASEQSSPSLPDPSAVYQSISGAGFALKTSPLLGGDGSSMLAASLIASPLKGVSLTGSGSGSGSGSSVRCPPVREAVDPAKYITIAGEPDGVKYACSKCGNIYKWRKSLNKHWKEKHDGELPDAAAARRFAARLPQAVRPHQDVARSSLDTPPSVVKPMSAASVLLSSPTTSRNASTPLNSLRSQQAKIETNWRPSPVIADSPFARATVQASSAASGPLNLTTFSLSRSPMENTSGQGSGGALDLSNSRSTGFAVQPMNVVSLDYEQAEPLDFSMKSPAGGSEGQRSGHSAVYPTTLERRSTESMHTRSVLLDCAQCPQKFTTVAQRNRHFMEAHIDALYAAAVASGDSGLACTGSTQLYRYLTAEQSHGATTDPVRCVICGASFLWRWAAARHFEQEHAEVRPNPYHMMSGIASSLLLGDVAGATQRGPMIGKEASNLGNSLRCTRCPFSTDSFALFARHQLHHSPRRPADLVTPDVSRIVWRSGSDDDVKAAELQLLTAAAAAAAGGAGVAPVNMDDVIGENTAIVIPQAPEETTAAKLSVPTPATTASKPYKLPGSRSSGGRSRRMEASSGSTASAETLLPFKCELCEYRARWPSEMTQHAKNHSDEKPYHCPQCTYRSKWKWDVVKHLKRCGGGGTARDVIDTTVVSAPAAPPSTATAAVSGQSARRRRPANVHSLLLDVATPQLLPALPDSGIASSSDDLAHKPPASREQLSNGPPNVTISAWPQSVGVKCALQDDVPVKTSSIGVLPPAQTKSIADERPPSAPVVSLVNQGLHYCLQCSFVGHSPAELRRHLRVHSDEKPYTCRTCCYSSKWKCDLKKHLRAYNHVSAVPMAYGGHGRKTSITDDDNSGQTDDGGDGVDTESAADGGDCTDAKVAKSSEIVNRSPNGGGSFAGITVGGRPRCRRCGFEAIDLTSLLQHKATHSSPSDKAEEESATGEDEQQRQPSSVAATVRPSHRRKSSKQLRVPPTSAESKYDAKMQGARMTNSASADVDQPLQPTDGSKFWMSLGLRSKNGVTAQPVATLTAMVEKIVPPTSLLRETREQPVKKDIKDLSSSQDTVEMVVAASPASSSTDVEYADLDVDEPVDLCQRAPEYAELSAESQNSSVSDQSPGQSTAATAAAPDRRLTAEADDASGVSKRKRRLRTCDKCGYVTDNLTTLQRHSAKHGSAGRHRCQVCDYTVDRQHILDYHVKSVHASTSASLSHYGGKFGSSVSHDDAASGTAVKCDALLAVASTRRRTADAEPSASVGRCICCGYRGYSVAAMTRHRLSHSAWSQPHCCQLCRRRTTTRRLLVQHCQSHLDDGDHRVDEPHACSRCPYAAASASELAAHERFHGAALRYKCCRCSFSHSRRRRLLQHQRLHAAQTQLASSSPPLLRCAATGCAFACLSRDQMTSHVRQHANSARGRRRFVCDRCSFTVDCRNALLHHQRCHARN